MAASAFEPHQAAVRPVITSMWRRARLLFLRSIPAALAVMMVLSAAGGVAPVVAETATRVFEGAWFEVTHPADFTVVPSLPSATGDGVDSAFFESPDGAVAFYVFAPQWGGVPTDIALDPAREELAGEETAERGGHTLTWRTFRAKDGSYERSYQITEDPAGPSLWVVGIRYRDAEALARHRPAYLRFKESLQLFAD